MIQFFSLILYGWSLVYFWLVLDYHRLLHEKYGESLDSVTKQEAIGAIFRFGVLLLSVIGVCARLILGN